MATDPRIFGQDPFNLALFLSPIAELLRAGAGTGLFSAALQGLTQRDVLAQRRREREEGRQEDLQERRLRVRMEAIRAVAENPNSAPFWNQILQEHGAPALPDIPRARNVLKELQQREAVAKILGQRLPVDEDLADVIAEQAGVERPLVPGGLAPAPGQGIAGTALRRAPVFVGPEAPQTVEETIGGRTFRLTPAQAATIAASRERERAKEPTVEERGQKTADVWLRRVQAANTPTEARAAVRGYNNYIIQARKAGAQLPGHGSIDAEAAAADVARQKRGAADIEGRTLRREERADIREAAKNARERLEKLEDRLDDANSDAVVARTIYAGDATPENKAKMDAAIGRAASARIRLNEERRRQGTRTEEQRVPARQVAPARAAPRKLSPEQFFR